MFQACVSISACIFYVFMNIYTGVCVYKWAQCWVKIKYTDLPNLFFSSPLRKYKKTKQKKNKKKIFFGLIANVGTGYKCLHLCVGFFYTLRVRLCLTFEAKISVFKRG